MKSNSRLAKKPKIALLLSGGGARGAYQIGVLKAIASFYPRNHGIPFPILCGTSAGAMNTTALGCYAPCFHLGVKKLDWIWRNMKTSQIYHSDLSHVSRYMFNNLTKWMRSDLNKNRPTSLLDNSPLRELLTQFIPFERLERNISNGYLHALSITASSYQTGNSMSFFQGHPSINDWKRSKRESLRGTLHYEHLMASAAIPLVFPAIEVRQAYYGDGSIHQLSPLSPPIHLGAEKILCIGLDSTPNKPSHSQIHHPSASSIAGHLLDSIFSDTLTSDIERLSRVNDTLALIPEPVRANLPLRHVETLLINPSIDIDQLAHKHYGHMPLAIRLLLKSIGIDKTSESSVVSYLLFEQPFCVDLIDAGFRDGMAQKQQLLDFLEIKEVKQRSRTRVFTPTNLTKP